MINGPLVDSNGNSMNRWAVPGDLEHSIVLTRLMAKNSKRMPPLATEEVDADAIRLLQRWIRHLEENNLPQSRL
jgi:hypothetical protein